MKNPIKLDPKKQKWCDSFLIKCISVILKTEKVDSDGYPSIEQLSKVLMDDGGFTLEDIELYYMVIKLKGLKKCMNFKG